MKYWRVYCLMEKFTKFETEQYRRFLLTRKSQKEKIQKEEKEEAESEEENKTENENQSNSSEYSSDYSSDESDIWNSIPLSHTVSFSPNHKNINSVIINDHSFILASTNKLSGYSFASLNINYLNELTKPSQTVECENSPLKLVFSPNKFSFLSFSNDTRFTLYNIKSSKFDTALDFRPGNPYLKDLRHTFGHTKTINDAVFDPSDPNRFSTCSNDKTLRIWDIDKYMSLQNSASCIPVKVKLRSLSYSTFFNNSLLCGDDEGKVSVYDKKSVKPAFHFNALQNPIESISSANLSALVSVQSASAISLYDLRNPKTALNTTMLHRKNKNTVMKMFFLNGDQNIATGLDNSVVIYDSELNQVLNYASSTAVTCLDYEPRLNQLVWATHDGKVTFGFTSSSLKGILTKIDVAVDIETIMRKRAADEAEMNVDSASKLYGYEKRARNAG